MESSASVSEAKKNDEAAAAGATRAIVISTLRQIQTILIRTLSRYAAAPHRFFRPENLTVQRVEQALHQQAGGNDQLLRGLLAQYRSYGIRQTLALKSRSIVLNSIMGTILFGSYDALRDSNHQANLRDAAAGLVAGSLHGAVCAPLEVASRRLTQQLSAGTGAGQLSFRSLRSALLGGPRGQLQNLSVSVLPLSVARDGLGIACFFLTFEGLQANLLHCLPLARTERVGQEHQDVVMAERAPTIGCLRTVATLTAGGCAGVAYKLAAFPFDVLLVHRLQECEVNPTPPSLIPYTRRLLQEIGPRRFLPQPRALASAFPSSALGLFVYDWLR